MDNSFIAEYLYLSFFSIKTRRFSINTRTLRPFSKNRARSRKFYSSKPELKSWDFHNLYTILYLYVYIVMGIPNSWMVFVRENPTKLDDDWGVAL